jgi:perosamine synthetase
MGGGSCVSVSSCMAALHLAWIELGVGPGDEILVPAQTHVATAHAVALTGATPVFVDCDSATGNVTAETLSAAMGPKTRGIGLVHFLGVPCDMTAIMALAETHDLRVVEDCALAVGARWDGRHVGLHGDAGCFSFYPAKHITTGEGGLLVTRRPELAKAVAHRRAFAVDRSRKTLPGTYDVTALGLNYRMSEMQAALGRGQLTRVETILKRREENASQLREALGDVPGIRLLGANDARGPSSNYALGMIIDDMARRDALALALREEGVETSVYYPHPVPRLAWYREQYPCDLAAFPKATAISDAGLALPVGPHLNSEDVAHLASRIRHHLEEMA